MALNELVIVSGIETQDNWYSTSVSLTTLKLSVLNKPSGLGGLPSPEIGTD